MGAPHGAPLATWRAAGRELVVVGRGRRVGQLARLHELDGGELLLVYTDGDALSGAPAACDAPGVVDALERGVLYGTGVDAGGPYRGAEQGARGPAYVLVPAVRGATLAGAVRRARGGTPWDVPAAAALGASVADVLTRLAPPLERFAPSAVVVREDGAVRLRSAFLEWTLGARPDGALPTKDPWVSYLRPDALDRAAPRVGDTYGLGVLLWELLAGAPLFARDGDHATLLAVARAVVPPLSALRADVPTGLAAVVAAMLARDPNLRPGAERARAELARFGSDVVVAPPDDPPEPTAYLSER